jgi:hypothetical protein
MRSQHIDKLKEEREFRARKEAIGKIDAAIADEGLMAFSKLSTSTLLKVARQLESEKP